MRWTHLGVLLLIVASMANVSACTLTHDQRLAYLYKAIQMLERGSAPATAVVNKGVFRVRARRYYDYYKSVYVPVKRVHVHERSTWAKELTEWNSSKLDEFELRLQDAVVGQEYQVKVQWEDGQTYSGDFVMKSGGTVVVVEKPN